MQLGRRPSRQVRQQCTRQVVIEPDREITRAAVFVLGSRHAGRIVSLERQVVEDGRKPGICQRRRARHGERHRRRRSLRFSQSVDDLAFDIAP